MQDPKLSLDLGDMPVGIPPTTAQQIQLRKSIGLPDASQEEAEDLTEIEPRSFSPALLAVSIAKMGPVDPANNNAVSIGVHSTEPIGVGAINIQPERLSPDGIASGISAIAIGRNTKASGNRSVAIGTRVTASGARSAAIGWDADAAGTLSVAIGDKVQALADRVVEVGIWNTPTSRQGAMRIDRTGRVAFTYTQRNFPFTAHTGLAGAESDTALAPGMFAFRIAVLAGGSGFAGQQRELHLDLNQNGTIYTINLGVLV